MGLLYFARLSKSAKEAKLAIILLMQPVNILSLLHTYKTS